MIYTGNCLDILPTLDAESVQCVVTSPPYFGLRDYGVDGQIGLEKTPEEYVANMVQLFREVRRVLKDDGVLWLNLGDSYASGKSRYSSKPQTISGKSHDEPSNGNKPDLYYHPYLKDKDLVGIPWRVALALQADGWWLRQDIIWAKPNPMPESVTDRCTKSHEYIFLLTKAARYFYDQEAVKEGSQPATLQRCKSKWVVNTRNSQDRQDFGRDNQGKEYPFRNRRSVWTITTKPFKEAHFATFPPEIPEICIKAGSKPGDTILDPFGGAGTTGLVAEKLGRKYIGIELNPAYSDMAEKRIDAARLPLAEQWG